MLKAQPSAKSAITSYNRPEEVPLSLKFAYDMFGLFAYLFVMGGLLPSDRAADLPAGREK